MTRMASGTNSSSNGSTYTYRADGQRLSKMGGPYVYGLVLSPGGPAYYEIRTTTPGTPAERYYYDGTMGFEDSTTASGTTKISRYGLGARGIDRIEYYDGSSTTYGYPLYDGHGNMRATLYKTTTGLLHDQQNWKTYDVWGSVRSDGGGTPNPKQRYCANLGHVADDETDLIYMRARYYEPNTGRFVSRDLQMDGWNWFVYSENDPVNKADVFGGSTTDWVLFVVGLALALFASLFSEKVNTAMGIGLACVVLITGLRVGREISELRGIISGQTQKILQLLNKDMNSLADQAAEKSLAAPALARMALYSGQIEGVIIAMEMEEIWTNAYNWPLP